LRRRGHQPGQPPSARTLRRAGRTRGLRAGAQTLHPRPRSATRHSLLLGTALASTLLIATVTAPTTANAQATCPPGAFPPPGPIDISAGGLGVGTAINCNNSYDRANAGIVIDLLTNTTAGHAISLKNYGDLTSTTARSIRAYTQGAGSPVTVTNRGDLDSYTTGIYARSTFGNLNVLSVDVFNSGHITSAFDGIQASAGHGGNPNSAVSVYNTGDIDSEQQGTAISARSYGINSDVYVFNSGTLSGAKYGISVGTDAAGSRIDVLNSGAISVISSQPDRAIGIDAFNNGSNSPVSITNSGDILATSSLLGAYGIRVFVPNSTASIKNSASVYAVGPATETVAGIYAYSPSGTTIMNSGDIGASSNLAILGTDGPVDIFNSGTITGFVLLDADDTFTNQAGGVFEARGTSDFDRYGAGGNDLFVNQNGATVHAAGDGMTPETTRLINLETFRNQGLISTVDGGTGDQFILSNTQNGTDFDFVASGNSTVALDVFLQGPASPKDTFKIEGDVSGQTTVVINNTNPGAGIFNPTGIPVIFVDGDTPNPNAFVMNPVDAGFFDYDIYFVPTGSGFWELRSFPGGGAHLLPQLVTAAQDIWHQGSSTWFDRTADLRVLLNGGAAPSAYDPGGKSLGASGPAAFTPAVWVRGSGSWLDRDDSAKTSAYGRNYTFDLDRDLETMDFQMGLDLGTRDLLSPGDILVFGLLGGFIQADLDYDDILREFDFDGGQVGAYATYLKGGLFVDTLLNVHLLELDANHARGFPGSELDVNTVGLRTDTGYRFGSFSGGAFLEPLATLEVTWADIDGFSVGGNTVSFDDEANVRGRLGLRAGTTMEAWQGTLMEPFLIGSLWGNFTDDNQAALTSSGRTFRFQDDLDDVWGEVSAGVNFFNPSATTAVFAKVDVTFGDDVSGVGGKAGIRVAW
jgi:outer membrane autotransporter protein